VENDSLCTNLAFVKWDTWELSYFSTLALTVTSVVIPLPNRTGY
jgi:hypothetical protein